MHLPNHVRLIIGRLEAAGHQAYAVGGCVRDSLAGRTPPDYDIATSAYPDETKAVFADFKTVDIGAKHGTIAVITADGKAEITTFRSDGDYTDCRRPDNVTFTRDLHTDLSRRDFTVNAMAYSQKTGLVDLFGGEQDLRAKVLRCVGEAEKRFREDALRIMRALRFMSEHGFICEAETEKALRTLKDNLLKIAPERIAAEFDRLLLGDYAEEVIMKYCEVLGVFIPEVLDCAGFDQRNPYHIYDVLEHTAKALTVIPAERILRLTMFFHDIAKPECFRVVNGYTSFKGHAAKGAEIAEATMRRLRYDNAAINKVKLLISAHDDDIYANDISVKKVLNKYGLETLLELCEVMIADDKSKAGFVEIKVDNHVQIMVKACEIVQSGECYSLPQLAVNGDDLTELGYKGEEIGRILQELLNKVITGEAINEKEALLNVISGYRN